MIEDDIEIFKEEEGDKEEKLVVTVVDENVIVTGWLTVAALYTLKRMIDQFIAKIERELSHTTEVNTEMIPKIERGRKKYIQ